MKTKLKILHLEDTPADAELVARELKKGNILFEILVVGNKTTFEKALKEFSPDIIISDHTLPSFDSTEAIRMVKQKAIKIPFILVTATVSDEYAMEVMKAGADDYILKDRLHRLPQAVLNALEKNRTELNLQTIFDNTSEGFILVDNHGIVKTFNTKAAQNILLNIEKEIKVGSNFYDFIHPSRLDNYKGVGSKIAAGETLQFEYSYERKNGDVKWYSSTINPVYNKSGDIEGACITSNDITARKKAEDLLSESEAFNKGVLSSLSSHITVINAEGTLVAVNKAWDDFAKTNGVVTLEGVSTGSNYIEVCQRAMESGDDLAGQTLRGIQSVFDKEVKTFELEYPCHSPKVDRWYMMHVSPFGEDDTKIVISHQNITERKIAENNLSKTSVELQKTLSELNKILDSSLDVICTIDVKGEFVNVSAASQQVWGYTPDELIGSKFTNLVHPDDAEMTSQAAEEMFSGIRIPVFENRYIHKSGSVVPILWSMNWDEKLQLMYCIAKDVTEKKRMEKAVETERDQFFEMFLKAPSAIGMLKGANHVFEMANPLYLQLTGKKDITGKTVAEVLPEVIEQGFVSILDHVYQTGESYSGKETLVKVDTSGNGILTDFYMNFVYQAYRNGEGEIEGVFFFINNITEQILSRKEIEKSEKFFKGVLESSNDMITIIDPIGKTIYASPGVSKNFGYTNEECLNLNIADVVHPDDAPIMHEFIGKIMMNPGVPMECPLIRDRKKDGTYMWVEGTLTNFIETDGINAIVANFRDITEKKLADEENRFQANLLNMIGQAAIATDLDGNVNYWNKAAEKIYGWTKAEAIGKYIVDLTASEASKEQGIQIMEALKQGESWSGEFKTRRKDGTIFPALVTNSPISNEQNILSGIIGISSDITEIKKLEALLEKTNRLARIGGWEIDVLNETVFWSDIIKEIREVDKDYVPQLGEGISYFKEGSHKETISKRVQECIETGTAWDEELQIITFKGNEKWVRTIGEGTFLNGKCLKIHGSFQDITDRKNAEIKIRESEFRYRQIVETAQEGIWMLDENNETTFVNQKMCEIMGYSYDEMMGKSSFFFKDEADLQNAIDTHKKRRQGIIETYDTSFITKDGRLIWTQISSNPIFDHNAKYKGALRMVSDITEKLKADKLLVESEQKYRKLATELRTEQKRLVTAQSIAKVGSWETDLNTFHVNWSNETHRIFGTNPKKFEASHSAFLDFIHPEDREKVNTAFMRSLHKNKSISMEHRIITLQGMEKWVKENWAVTTDEKGLPKVAVGTCQDITASKSQADKVIRNEAKLNVAQYIAHVGSYEVDMVTGEHSWSDEFYRILGIKANVTPSHDAFLSFVHPDDQAMAVSAMEDALYNHVDSSFQFRFTRKNGETGYASSEWNFEFEPNGQPLYLHGILRDLTKEKKAESERVKIISDLVQRNSDLEQFSYIVSHNLRAPTANIIGFAEILQDETITQQEHMALLQGLSASVTGLDTIIKDINSILQDKREVHDKKEVIFFSKLVGDIMLSIANLIEKHEVRIISDFTEVDEIYSLRVYIYSIFYNLISNSIKYSKPAETPLIEIKSKKEIGKIILTFKDNGLGIDMKTKGDKIFGLYNRFHSHVEGKGMGLFMVKTQVESLGGKITISSELNKGTKFKIVFEI